MLKSQSIQVKLPEVREKLNMLDDAASVEDTNALTGQYQALEAQYRAALIVEASDVQQAATAAPGDAGETAEIRGLLARARVSRYLLAAAGQADPGGAEAELRIALLGAEAPETMIPLDMLQSRQEEGQWEKRADSHTNIGTSYVEQQAVIMPRLFAGSAGAFMGIDRPTVAVGTASYPVLTGGVAADFRNPSVGKDSEAASFAVAQVEPARVTARYTFNYESLARMAGLEEALTVDLRMAVEDKLDAVALKG